MGSWIKSDLAPLRQHLLEPSVVERRGLFDPAVVSRTVAAHESSAEDHTDHLLALMNLEIWCRLYLDGAGVDDLGLELNEAVAA